MDVHDIPVKSALLRTGLLARVFDPAHDISAEEFNAIVDAVKAGGGGGVGPFLLKHIGALYTDATLSKTTVLLDGAPVSGGSNLPGSVVYPIPLPCTAAALYVNVISNTATTPTVVVVYKNGSPTAITLAIAGGATGLFHDTAHSVSFGEGDTYALVVTNTGGGAGGEVDLLAVVGLNPLSPIDPDAADATTSTHGMMSAASLVKLNGIDVGARLKVAASFTFDPAVGLYLVDTSAGDVVATLPATIEHGWTIKKITTDTHKITLAPNGTDHIEGTNASLDLPNSGDPARGAWRVDGSLQTGALGWWVE